MAERLLLSCEHAGNRVPRWLRERFRGAEAVLASHRGVDLGALQIARALATAWDAPLHLTETSRLVIETNRSLGHPRLFSEFTRDCSASERTRILAEHYHAHRDQVIERCRRWIAAGDRVLHLGIHSFTPELAGEVRHCELALLYDPARRAEQAFCVDWLARLAALRPDWRLRRNYPYRGAADGLTTSLRRLFPPGAYRGIELEVNQALAANAGARRQVIAALAASLPPLR